MKCVKCMIDDYEDSKLKFEVNCAIVQREVTY